MAREGGERGWRERAAREGGERGRREKEQKSERPQLQTDSRERSRYETGGVFTHLRVDWRRLWLDILQAAR